MYLCGIKCFYYGYEFSDQVDGNVRSAFIKYVKFSEALHDHPDLTHFIKKAVDNLNKKINLYDYNLVVMPHFLEICHSRRGRTVPEDSATKCFGG